MSSALPLVRGVYGRVRLCTMPRSASSLAKAGVVIHGEVHAAPSGALGAPWAAEPLADVAGILPSFLVS